MKKLLIAALLLFPSLVFAAEIPKFPPGYISPNGNQLNLMVAQINNLTGNGTPSAITGTTGTFTGLLTGSAGLTLTGTTSASALICATYAPNSTPAATDKVFFIATRAMRVVTASQIHTVAAGGASKLQITKDTGTSAPGAGSDILSNNTNAGFDLAATANTVQVGTFISTTGLTTLAAGDRLAVDYADAIQSTAGVVVTACMAPL